MGRGNRKLVDLVVDRYVNLDLFYRQQQTQPSGCIEWTGVRNNVGYGFIGFRNIDAITGEPAKGDCGMMTTHRLAWMIHHKRLPELRNINHTCHNKLCVNPDHLEEGTQEDKILAMARDGVKTGSYRGHLRGAYLHKQQSRTYKYTDTEIQWIRDATTDAIVNRYGVTKQRAASMRYGFRKSYKWLPWNKKEK